ncbi:hypothetical protein QWZ13_11605 [Reinekea marina]|nr:hypothetical protein [Reinekea marina]MDN3649561.1 hypothetical protein [Reinekea marina]
MLRTSLGYWLNLKSILSVRTMNQNHSLHYGVASVIKVIFITLHMQPFRI